MSRYTRFKFNKDWIAGLDNCLSDKLITKEEYHILLESLIRYGLDSNYSIDNIPLKLKAVLLIPYKEIDRERNKKCEIKEINKLSTNEQIRKSNDYKTWRKLVFERDNYTCQSCHKRGGQIEAHHLRPFSVFKEDRFNVENGVTLCKKCHKKWHKKFGINPKEIFLL